MEHKNPSKELPKSIDVTENVKDLTTWENVEVWKWLAASIANQRVALVELLKRGSKAAELDLWCSQVIDASNAAYPLKRS